MGNLTAIKSQWSDLCQSEEFQGRWIALDRVEYDGATKTPLRGEVVDSDEDIASLCARLRNADRTACAVLFCDAPPSSSRLARSGRWASQA